MYYYPKCFQQCSAQKEIDKFTQGNGVFNVVPFPY